MSFYTQGTAQTVMWPCKPIILSIGYLEDPTEVLLKISEIMLLMSSLAMKANFI